MRGSMARQELTVHRILILENNDRQRAGMEIQYSGEFMSRR